MNRRQLLKTAAAAAVGGGAGVANDGARGEQAAAETITAADLAVGDKIAGRSYGEAERELMVARVSSNRDRMRDLRALDLGDTAPAFQFDPRLPGTLRPGGKSSFRLSSGSAPRYSGNPESLAFKTVVELSRLIRARKVTSAELTRVYLGRLKRYDPTLHCVVTLTEDLALRQAARADAEIAAGQYRGPLHGIPWGAKDILATKGIRTTWGARPYKDQVIDTDATVVQRLEAAGAVLVAKLTTGELAMGDIWFGGRTRNPWNPEEGSSGSSAGPGSAVAAGLVGLAVGSETLGSIVSPSVVCGVTGLRPTFGRIPRSGAMTLSWTLDKLGPMCRGVEDCALVFHAIQGPDGRDASVADIPFRWDPRSDLKSIRVGYQVDAFDELAKEPAKKAIYDAVLQTLRSLGVELRPVRLPDRSSDHDALWMILNVEAGASFQKLVMSEGIALLEGQGNGSWPNTFRVASTISAVDFVQIMRLRRQLQEEMAAALAGVDVYVTPAMAPPNPLFTNFTGHPTVVTRCGTLDRERLCVEFIGNLDQDAAALRVAFAYEQATEWHRQWPDL